MVGSLAEAGDESFSKGDVDSPPHDNGDSSGRDGMLDQLEIQNPQKDFTIKDLRNLKINEKSEDTGSMSHAVTPKEHQWLSAGAGAESKVTSPLDNNASYIDKSMTRQFHDLN